MPKPYLKEFRGDVVRVAQNRDTNTMISEIASDLGIHEGTLNKWLRRADLGAGTADHRKSGATSDEKVQLRAANRRIKVLEQELEFMRRAAAYFGQAQTPSK